MEVSLLFSVVAHTTHLLFSALVAEMSASRGRATSGIQVPQDELPVFPKKTLIAIVVLTVIITVNMNYGWYKDRQALDIPPLDKEYALYKVSKPAPPASGLLFLILVIVSAQPVQRM